MSEAGPSGPFTCAGLTKKGEPCKRPVAEDGARCFLHTETDSVEESSERTPELLEHVENWFRYIGRALEGGLLVIGAVLISKLAGGGGEIQIPGIDNLALPAAWSLAILFALTLVHLFATIFAIVYLLRAYRSQTIGDESTLRSFQQITVRGSLFMRGLHDRHQKVGRFYPIRLDEPSAWITHFSAIGLLLAGLPWAWSFSLSLRAILETLAAFAIVYLNWHIGSQWAVLLSEMGHPKPERQATEQMASAFGVSERPV